MYFTPDQMEKIMASHAQAEPLEAFVANAGELVPQTFPSSMSLLSYLPYVPSERDQGQCGDCWAWAGTGTLEIAHNVQNGVADRLSVQLLNTCNPYVNCCDGGWLDNVAQFYTYEGFAVPWSNTGGNWSSGDGSCGAACGTVATSPQYVITNISVTSIVTTGVGQTAAIANIKTALNQKKAVWFGFFMGSDADWSKFDNFWGSQPETAQWTNFNPGEAYTTGGGHAILCVGYDDNAAGGPAWIMVNSWGTTTGRPDGTLEVSQNIDYDGNVMMGSSPYQQLSFETLNVGFESQTTNTLAININGSGSVQVGGSNAPSILSLPNGSTVTLSAQGSFVGCPDARQVPAWYRAGSLDNKRNHHRELRRRHKFPRPHHRYAARGRSGGTGRHHQSFRGRLRNSRSHFLLVLRRAANWKWNFQSCHYQRQRLGPGKLYLHPEQFRRPGAVVLRPRHRGRRSPVSSAAGFASRKRRSNRHFYRPGDFQ